MSGISSKLTVIHYAVLPESAGKKQNSEILNTVLSTDMSSDTAVAVSNWANNFVTSLSNDVYSHCKIESEISLNEILSD